MHHRKRNRKPKAVGLATRGLEGGSFKFSIGNDIWNDIELMLNKVMKHNEGTYVEEQLLIMERNGYPEETYYTFSYTPVAGDFGGTAGMICFNTDDTDRIIIEHQLITLTDLGKALSDRFLVSTVLPAEYSVLSGPLTLRCKLSSLTTNTYACRSASDHFIEKQIESSAHNTVFFG